MDKDLHDNINDYFSKEFGAPFRNSMLCTGNERHASYFGTLYHVFPVGNFQYLWNANIEDLNHTLSDVNYTVSRNKDNRELDWRDMEAKVHDTFLNKVIRGPGWSTTNLQKGIKSNNEIMVRCKKYYGLDESSLPYPETIAGANKILQIIGN